MYDFYLNFDEQEENESDTDNHDVDTHAHVLVDDVLLRWPVTTQTLGPTRHCGNRVLFEKQSRRKYLKIHCHPIVLSRSFKDEQENSTEVYSTTISNSTTKSVDTPTYHVSTSIEYVFPSCCDGFSSCIWSINVMPWNPPNFGREYWCRNSDFEIFKMILTCQFWDCFRVLGNKFHARSVPLVPACCCTCDRSFKSYNCKNWDAKTLPVTVPSKRFVKIPLWKL